ncbi:MAG TPA: class I SAM-dependent methyltransferase [Sandaracinaceae bacterium LLY-WYZ-13_1]|nr:class I SAM-dependent methyltransferase [Sandaracinaceae bacterium LLY-WYZ-13_1]
MDDYGVVPYDCRPDPLSHPWRLGVAARRAGLEAPDVHRFRMLELGCADGSHLLPIAAAHPDCEIVGVERGSTAAGVAVAAAERLGLENLRILNRDLRELPDDLGTFDYVVAHGLYSWVPPDVRERVLEICATHLSERGVAYVSYNAEPGGGFRVDVRQTLLAAAPPEDPPRQRLAAARRALDALAELVAEPSTGYAHALAELVAMLRGQPDSALLHDYLASTNEAFSLSAFVGAAARHGLSFVGDQSSLHAGGVQRIHLKKTLEDGEQPTGVVEAFTDLLRYRGFRRTVLARRAPPEAPPTPRAFLDGLHLATSLRPRTETPSLEEGIAEELVTPEGVTVTQERALAKAVLLVLAAVWPETRPWPEVVDEASSLLERHGLGGGAPSPAAVELLAADVTFLHQINAVDVSLGPRVLPAPDPVRPSVRALTRDEVQRHSWMSTATHEHLELDPFDRALVPLLDGSRDPPAVTAAMYRMVRDGRLTIRGPQGRLRDPSALAEAVPRIIAGKLRVYGAAGVLEPKG